VGGRKWRVEEGKGRVKEERRRVSEEESEKG